MESFLPIIAWIIFAIGLIFTVMPHVEDMQRYHKELKDQHDIPWVSEKQYKAEQARRESAWWFGTWVSYGVIFTAIIIVIRMNAAAGIAADLILPWTTMSFGKTLIRQRFMQGIKK